MIIAPGPAAKKDCTAFGDGDSFAAIEVVGVHFKLKASVSYALFPNHLGNKSVQGRHVHSEKPAPGVGF